MKPSVRASSVEGLRQELKALRRQVQDLHREQSWQYDPTEAEVGGSDVEGFRAAMVGALVTGSTYYEPVWDWGSDAWAYHTSGVALSSGGVVVDLPAGFWILSAQLDIYCNTAPSSGKVNAGIQNLADAYDGAGEVKFFPHWPTGDSKANVHLTHHVYLPSPGQFSAFYLNDLDQTITATGQFSGTRIGDASTVTFGGP